ncbi:chemotaxis protein MotB [Desulfonatronum thiosulfatophilum]|uniref:Chemotaxis protein MotB n=1 Tax=Desulfonatronum thiosulfatophilum TaxID=617002 RepID=A0A1G6E9K6_9BACT|nr:OmpA family protein [Desulfonatronum thiosulfatophilum]SDB54073.1 chemotaxis protein MotB [Desulfonatronum thiosulfatophilum]
MAGKREKKEKQVGTPGWLLTFTGLMILIMAFFVYLVTNASLMDERRIRLAIGSLLGAFGMASGKPDALGVRESLETYQPGPMPPDQDLASLKELLWDDVEEDLQFVSNRFVQIFSVNTAVLFHPGETDLTEQGRHFLRQVAPTLRNVTVPVLIAGHGSTLRDEFDADFEPALSEAIPDLSWQMSLFRALNVYRFLLEQGVSSEILRMEGLGRFHPREDPRTPEGRRNNRRVEFILDRRAMPWAPLLERPAVTGTTEKFIYRDFIFRFPDAHDPEPIRP